MKRNPLDGRTEFKSPDLIDAPLGRMGEICREDFYNKRLDTDASGAFCLLADAAIRVIDRGWADWDNMAFFDAMTGALVGLAKSMGSRAEDWYRLGLELRLAGEKFRARVEKMKAEKSAKRKKARARKK